MKQPQAGLRRELRVLEAVSVTGPGAGVRRTPCLVVAARVSGGAQVIVEEVCQEINRVVELFRRHTRCGRWGALPRVGVFLVAESETGPCTSLTTNGESSNSRYLIRRVLVREAKDAPLGYLVEPCFRGCRRFRWGGECRVTWRAHVCQVATTIGGTDAELNASNSRLDGLCRYCRKHQGSSIQDYLPGFELTVRAPPRPLLLQVLEREGVDRRA